MIQFFDITCEGALSQCAMQGLKLASCSSTGSAKVPSVIASCEDAGQSEVLSRKIVAALVYGGALGFVAYAIKLGDKKAGLVGAGAGALIGLLAG